MPGSSSSYSAHVTIELRVNGHRFRVAKLGPDRLYLDAPELLPASSGEVVMHIDGHERRWRVALQPGAQPERIVMAEFTSG